MNDEVIVALVTTILSIILGYITQNYKAQKDVAVKKSEQTTILLRRVADVMDAVNVAAKDSTVTEAEFQQINTDSQSVKDAAKALLDIP